LWGRVQKIIEDANSVCATPAEATLRYTIRFGAVTTVILEMCKEKNFFFEERSLNKGPLPVELFEKLKKHRWIRNYYK